MTAAPNVHESAARFRKALALADVLDAAGHDGEPITDVQWRLAERAAQVRPSSAKTRETVVSMLVERRRLRAGDPFEGLVDSTATPSRPSPSPGPAAGTGGGR